MDPPHGHMHPIVSQRNRKRNPKKGDEKGDETRRLGSRDLVFLDFSAQQGAYLRHPGIF